MTLVTNHLAQLARLEQRAQIAPYDPHDPPIAFPQLIDALRQAGCDLRGPKSVAAGARSAENAWIGMVAEVMECTSANEAATARLLSAEAYADVDPAPEAAALDRTAQALGRALDKCIDHALYAGGDEQLVTNRCIRALRPWREEFEPCLPDLAAMPESST